MVAWVTLNPSAGEAFGEIVLAGETLRTDQFRDCPKALVSWVGHYMNMHQLA